MRKTSTSVLLVVPLALAGCATTTSTDVGSSDTGTPTAVQRSATPSGGGLAGASRAAGPTGVSAPGGSGAAPVPGEDSDTDIAADQPTGLSMPTIGFDRPVEALGVNEDGEINPPRGVVQWYDKSVSPGRKGISVIAGHVFYRGPDVFSDLDKLSVGDVVSVKYGNGSSRKFRVYETESVDKRQLQTDARVWGEADKPILALITCDSGSRVVGSHHVDNLVVWAEPA